MLASTFSEFCREPIYLLAEVGGIERCRFNISVQVNRRSILLMQDSARQRDIRFLFFLLTPREAGVLARSTLVLPISLAVERNP